MTSAALWDQAEWALGNQEDYGESAPSACLPADGERQTGQARGRPGFGPGGGSFWAGCSGGRPGPHTAPARAAGALTSPGVLAQNAGTGPRLCGLPRRLLGSSSTAAGPVTAGSLLCARLPPETRSISPAGCHDCTTLQTPAQGQVFPSGATGFSRRSELFQEARSSRNGWCVEVCAALRLAAGLVASKPHRACDLTDLPARDGRRQNQTKSHTQSKVTTVAECQ